ncbi:hypothetical protein [Cellulomonas sp.]|uniref:hypothetical protein n=1 Tax=Cellulomonas sp. TaxID=40001 RepID=UPI001B225D6B|nr:hypothetical protein [Cellulomonas sp.]MBO9553593.1 hypothetical protein [Cellulomonas sp.]
MTDTPPATPQVRHHEQVLLEPNHGRYDPTGVRRQYEGSSVQLGPDVVTWTPPSHRFYDRGGFSCPIGDHAGQAHRITRLRAAFPSRYSPGIVDRYVITDTAGTVLGSFPSGEGVTGSSLPEHQAGWYPATVVREAAGRAGLVWDERDFTGNATELQAAFPGVVPHARAMEINQWVQTTVYTTYGLLAFAGGVAWVVFGGYGRFVFPPILLCLGALLAWAGTTSSPPMLRRQRERPAAPTVEDSSSPR